MDLMPHRPSTSLYQDLAAPGPISLDLRVMGFAALTDSKRSYCSQACYNDSSHGADDLMRGMVVGARTQWIEV